jgi:hypothetical protein
LMHASFTSHGSYTWMVSLEETATSFPILLLSFTSSLDERFYDGY